MLVQAAHQRVLQPLAHRQTAPLGRLLLLRPARFHGSGELDQPLGGVRAAIKDQVLAKHPQLGLDVVVDRQGARIDDAHVHARRNRGPEEDAVDGLANLVIAPEAEAEVAEPSADEHSRPMSFDPLDRLDEVDGVAVVLFDACSDGKDVGVDDDVGGAPALLFNERAADPAGDFDAAVQGVRLALLIKEHHHGGGAIAPHHAGLANELLLALLQADGVDDGLALHALEARLDDAPLAGVDHEGHAADVRLGGGTVEELDHGALAVQQALIHVDVENLRAIFDLLKRHGQSLLPELVVDEAAEAAAARDVAPLAHVHEVCAGEDLHPLQAAESGQRAGLWNRARSGTASQLCDGADVGRSAAAAAADDVGDAVVGIGGHKGGHLLGSLVIFAQLIGKPGVGVRAHQAGRLSAQRGEVGAKEVSSQGAVQADNRGFGVLDGGQERLQGLTAEGASAGVGDGAADPKGQVDSGLIHGQSAGLQGGLGIEGVEDGLDEEQVHAALDEAKDVVAVGRKQLVESDAAVAGLVDVGAEAGGAVGRADSTGHPGFAPRSFAGHFGGGAAQLLAPGFEAVVGQRDRVGVEGVGGDDLRARFDVLSVNLRDEVGPGEGKQVVGALQLIGMVRKGALPVVLFAQAERLE